MVISTVVIISQMTRQAEDISSLGLSLENFFIPFLLILLPLLAYVLPIAFLFACMVAFLRLSADGEMTALRAAGMSLWRASVPVLITSIFLTFVGFVCSFYLDPWARNQFELFFYRQAQNQLDIFLKTKLQPGVFNDGFFGLSMYAEDISQDKSSFTNVILGPVKNNPSHQTTIYAKKGELHGSIQTHDLTLSLFDGTSYQRSITKDSSTIVHFEKADFGLLNLFRENFIAKKFDDNDYRNFSPTKLRSFYLFQLNKINEMKKNNETTNSEFAIINQSYLKARFLYFHRISVPFIILSFGLMGMSFGIQSQRSGKNYAYLFTLIVFVMSYVVLMYFRGLGNQGKIDALLAVVLPNVLLFLLSVYILHKKNILPPSARLGSYFSFNKKIKS